MIEPTRFAAHATKVRVAADALCDSGDLDHPPTFFEQLTAVAFLEFAERSVDIAVLEVGLGGRLDATNVVAPLVCVVTPISYDHEQHLGSSLSAIAGEKAAIIKRGSAAVIGHQPAEALDVVLRQCLASEVLPTFSSDPFVHYSERGCFTFTYETELDTYERVTLGLRGRHQVENALLAIHAAESLRVTGLAVPRSAILEGLSRATWPGRLEMVLGAPPMLLDGAHNVAGAAALRAYLDEFCHCPLTLVFGVTADKDAVSMANVLFPSASSVVLTRARSPRAADPTTLAAALPSPRGGGAPIVTSAVEEALSWALQVTPRDGLICVAGSLYLVGEAKAWLASRAPVVPALRRR